MYKRYIRELRDSENKDYQIDKNYLNLKHLRDHYKQLIERSKINEIEECPQNYYKYAEMSYMTYIEK